MQTVTQFAARHGINISQAIRNMKARRAYAARMDRTKVFADTTLEKTMDYLYANKSVRTQMHLDQITLQLAADPLENVDTRAYVAAWSRLNHLAT